MRVRSTMLAAPAKASIVQKETVARLQSRVAPVYLVNEYPKSGGTWLKFMLADALGCPAWIKGRPAWAPCVMQAHWLASKGSCRTVVLFRDGRDVMVSLYYHSLFVNEFQNASLVRIMRGRLRFDHFEDIRTNLLAFMKFVIDTPLSPRFSWVDFVHAWTGRPEVVQTSYESLRADTAGELARIVEEVAGRQISEDSAKAIVEAHSMANMRKRKEELNPGLKTDQKAEVSFIRQGSVGGWSKHFSDEALEWFEARAGTALDKLGYARGRPPVTA